MRHTTALAGTVFLAAGIAAAAVAPQTNRKLTIVNRCPAQTLNVGAIGGKVQDCGPGSSCPLGTACNPDTKPLPSCFWILPAPSKGTSVLAPGASAVYELTAPAIDETVPTGQTIWVKWSGSIYAATGCAPDGTNCQTGMCNLNGQPVACTTPGVAPFPSPLTTAEFTLAPDGPDYYDVTLINGMNVPVSMTPDHRTSSPSDPYFCQTAGSVRPSSTGLLGCDWIPKPNARQSKLLAAVISSGASCSQGTCPAGQTCGLAGTFGTTTIVQACGTQIGWWTPDEICSYTGNGSTPIDCSANVSGQGQLVDLFGCVGANATSCYSQGATSSCCGCPEWKIGGKTLPVSAACITTNPQWKSRSLPWLSVFKKACPTAYTFPFDDATSLFTCNTPLTSPTSANAMNYTITFCPNGKTGLPGMAETRKRARHSKTAKRKVE